MIQQIPLPFAQDAASPAISAEPTRFHYDKHFAGYVTKANAAVEETALADVPLEAIIFAAKRAPVWHYSRMPDRSGTTHFSRRAWHRHRLLPRKRLQQPLIAISGDTRRSPSNLSTSARSTLARAVSGSSSMRAGTYRYRQHMTRPRPGRKPTRRRCWSAICGNMPIISTSATTGRSSSPTLPQPTSIGPLHRTYIV